MKTSRNDGFSLVETLVVLSLVAVSLTLALPSWNEGSSKRQIADTSGELAMFLSSGRSLAVKHNRDVTVSLAHRDSANWCIGMSDSGAVCDCTAADAHRAGHCAVGGIPHILRDSDFSPVEMTTHSEDTTFVFDRIRGTLAASDSGHPHYFNLLSRDGKAGLQVNVSPTGVAIVCNWLETSATPAYRSCEPLPGGTIDPTDDTGALDI